MIERVAVALRYLQIAAYQCVQRGHKPRLKCRNCVITLSVLEKNTRQQDAADPGLHAALSYDVNEDVAAPYIAKGVKLKVAILREQGVNSHLEMAAAFTRAGFDAIDVHMSDVLAGRITLEVCGPCGLWRFLYGDVLGAGEGWAKSILFNSMARDQFEGFNRNDTFSLGV